MTWSDKILAALSIASFLLFLGVIVWFVREPDLIIVILIVTGLAIFDFWRESRQTGGARNGS